MTVYADASTTEPLPQVGCHQCLAVAQLAAQLESEAAYDYTPGRLVDVGVVAHRIRVVLGLAPEHALYRSSTAESRDHR